MMIPENSAFIAAGCSSVGAGLLHLGCMIGGPSWFRFFGAGNKFAATVEQGKILPYLITLGIACVLFGWAILAFSAAALLPRVPLLRTGLVLIIVVCLLRGLAIFSPIGWLPEHGPTFRIVSSLVVFALGFTFAWGTFSAWNTLSGKAL
jgi:hypothetical protein